MQRKRVIPVLLIQDGNLVKGEKFKKHKYIGDPINAVRIFNEKEVDELAVVDITAGISGRSPDYAMIEDIASEAFMPVAYGGGIRCLEQVEKLFRLGVEKVIINSSFFDNPDFIKECSEVVGSQSIVVAVDVKKNLFGRYEIYTQCGSHKVNLDLIEYVKKIQEFKAGEILLTSIDREGTEKGLDLELVNKVTNIVDIPVIAQGGVGNFEHIKQGVQMASASAVAVGSFFIFYGKHKAVLLTYPSNNELENLFAN